MPSTSSGRDATLKPFDWRLNPGATWSAVRQRATLSVLCPHPWGLGADGRGVGERHLWRRHRVDGPVRMVVPVRAGPQQHSVTGGEPDSGTEIPASSTVLIDRQPQGSGVSEPPGGAGPAFAPADRSAPSQLDIIYIIGG